MKQQTSSGGVVYKVVDGIPQVLISKHSGYHQWVLPKGLVEPGEKLEETAIREVKEEVGVTAKIIQSLGEPESYIYVMNGEKIHKDVYYFLMEYVIGSEDLHDFEMEDVKWATFDEAIELMGYEGAKKVLRKAEKLCR